MLRHVWVDRLRRALDRARDRLGGRHPPPSSGEPEPGRPWLPPPADVFESERFLLIRVDAPGAGPDNTTVRWVPGRGLALHVRRDPPPGAVGLWTESVHGDWHRTFPLGPGFDGARARTTVRDGVVTILVPRTAPGRRDGMPARAT